LRRYASSGRPFLGICLGMQMLVSVSEEFGVHEGLGIIPGKVVAIAGRHPDGSAAKVPHIGWSALEKPAARAAWDGTLLDGLDSGASSAYFVHSFAVVPDEEHDRLADTWHGDLRVCAAIQRGRVSGCQFHPEKSGPAGLRIMKNFLESR
jgi:imidazole glycerol-phosphate synthase subunit HisH